jgi:periplasmic protein TonB
MKTIIVSAAIHVGLVGLTLLYPHDATTKPVPPRRPPILIYNPLQPDGPKHTTGSGRTGGPGAPPSAGPGAPPGLAGGPNVDIRENPIAWPGTGADTVWGGSPRASGGGQPAGGVLSADVVEVQVTPLPGAPTPRYPEALRAAGIEGRVAMEFVVDTAGRVEAGSLRVIASDAGAFVASVRAALIATRYHPALVGGRPVRQLVRQEFAFALSR